MNLQFDFVKRYRALAKVSKELGNVYFEKSGEWYQARADYIEERLSKKGKKL